MPLRRKTYFCAGSGVGAGLSGFFPKLKKLEASFRAILPGAGGCDAEGGPKNQQDVAVFLAEDLKP